jgi:hypothetical protein
MRIEPHETVAGMLNNQGSADLRSGMVATGFEW